MTSVDRYPRSLSHIGIGVNDINASVEWYEDILGLERVLGPEKIFAGEEHIGKLLAAVDQPPDFEWIKLALLTTGDHVGVEFYEFDRQGTRDESAERRPGLSHFCIQDPDIEQLAADIDANGGKHIEDVWRILPDEPYKMTYCKDPFGNVIEIHTHGFEQTHANLHSLKAPNTQL